MKKTGQCPKCNSTDIFTDNDKKIYGERKYIMISAFKSVRIANYVCLNCGFLEEYLEDRSMQDSPKMDKIRANWKKHFPNH